MASIYNASMLLYGPPGIGKSTFISELDDCAVFDTEGGLGWFDSGDINRIPIGSWREFKSCVETLVKGKRLKTDTGKMIAPKNIGIDTVDILWMYCTQFICKKHGFEHPGDESYGKGYQVLRYEFQTVLAKLNILPMGLVLASHSTSVEVRGRGSNTTKKVVPSIPGSACKVVIPMVDIVAYAGFDVVDDTIMSDRGLICHPQEDLEAKDRTQRLPRLLPFSADALDKALCAKPRTVKKGQLKRRRTKLGRK